MTGITIYKPNGEPGERAAETAIYTLADGTRIRVRAGSVIPEGATPDTARTEPADDREPEPRKKPAPANRAKKSAPENR